MEQSVEKAVSVQQEPTDEEETLNVIAKVSVIRDGSSARVALPPEMRLTERLVTYLHQALAERGLELKQWTLTPEQQEELGKLSNVVVEQREETTAKAD